MKINIQKYFKRINYDAKPTTKLSTLVELQKKHLLNIPFENLDIHFGRKIELDIEKFYHKIVHENRGGFCYELNGLFENLLSNIGFETSIISARVFDAKNNDFGEEYDHLAIIVAINQNQYLVDVGFGEFAFAPLLIHTDEIQKDPRGNFIIEQKDDEYIVSKLIENKKNIEYKFTLKNRKLSEFQEMCSYHQSSPNSHFTQKKLITKPTLEGRITLSGTSLKITKNNTIEEIHDLSQKAYFALLNKWFGITEDQLKNSTF